MNYRHFSGFNKESNFEKLSGIEQRAIETQANIDLEVHKLSKYYKAAFKEENTEIELFNILCDEYSNKPRKEIKKFVLLDSKALYYYPLTEDRMNYYQRIAEEKVKTFDNNIFIQTCGKFKKFSK